MAGDAVPAAVVVAAADAEQTGGPAAGSRVQIYLIRNQLADAVPLLAALPDAEQQVLAAIRHPRVRRERAASAWLRRELLARHLDCAPHALQFQALEHGKPALIDQAIQFNVSHSGDWLALALADVSVGIDIESLTKPRRWSALASQVLAPDELQAWQRVPPPDQPRALLARWTLKEAWLKGLGTGLSGGLQRTRFTKQNGQLRGWRDGEETRLWRFGHIEPSPGLLLSWAVAGPGTAQRRHYTLELGDDQRPQLKAQADSSAAS